METIIAKTQQDLEKIFKLRYQVYVEEEKKFGGSNFPDKMMYDEFDDKPNTFNIIMLEDGEAIGTIRITKATDTQEKLPSDKLYNFGAVRQGHANFIPGSIGMLAIHKPYRNNNTFMTLMLDVSKLLLKFKCDYYIFTLNHECSKLICRLLGARMIQEKFWSTEIRNFIIPMVLYKDQVKSFFMKHESGNVRRINNLMAA